MNIDRKSQEQLIQETEALAGQAKGNRRLGESYIIESNARLIESNARVEGEVGNLINVIQAFNKKADKQASTMVTLTWVVAGLTFLLFIGLIVQLIKG